MRTRLFLILFSAFWVSVGIGIFQYRREQLTIVPMNLSCAAIVGVTVYCVATRNESVFLDLQKALLIWPALPLASAEGLMESTLGFNEGIFQLSHFNTSKFPLLCCFANLALIGTSATLTFAYLRRKDTEQPTSLWHYVKTSLGIQIVLGPLIYFSLSRI